MTSQLPCSFTKKISKLVISMYCPWVMNRRKQSPTFLHNSKALNKYIKCISSVMYVWRLTYVLAYLYVAIQQIKLKGNYFKYPNVKASFFKYSLVYILLRSVILWYQVLLISVNHLKWINVSGCTSP